MPKLTPTQCPQSKMFELKDSVGRQLFETISITLVRRYAVP
ncbi:MAG: hypothetical protein ACKVJD_13005 [Burkholderiales bacterium]